MRAFDGLDLLGDTPSANIADDPAHRIHSDLSDLQFGASRDLLLIEPLAIGFGGQISGRLLALKLALELNRKAVFRDAADPPYVQTLAPQFADAAPVDWNSARLFDPTIDQTSQHVVRFDYFRATKALGTLNQSLESWTGQKLSTRYQGAPIASIDGAVLRWMRLLPKVAAFIRDSRDRLGIAPGMTLGVHLRRGDKAVESAYVPAFDVNRAIRDMYESWKFRAIFLASDSPDAFEEITPPPGVRLIFDHEEKRYNNANHKMLFANPDLAEQETLTAIKNLSHLCACGGLVGQDNTHFATIAASLILSRSIDPQRVILIDGRIAEHKSALFAAYWSAKRRLRRALRNVMPGTWIRTFYRIWSLKA